jgi:myosin heavy subunit
MLESEEESHLSRERDLLKVKEHLKLEQMEMELLNATRVADFRQQHEKQLVKFRSQFDEGLNELKSRCESRHQQLEFDLELRRRVEIHEVEERKNQHINDLIKNHRKAFEQMKTYYNDITKDNLDIIKKLQKQVEELKARASNNKRMLLEYNQQNEKLSEPLSKVSAEIAGLQSDLKERTKDQMALRNANSRLISLRRKATYLKQSKQQLEQDFHIVGLERDELYNTFEESIKRVQQQSEFHNQALEQKLRFAESNADKSAVQVEEIIRAANLDPTEMNRIMGSLNQMLTAKDDTLRDFTLLVGKFKKAFNDAYKTYEAKFSELGIQKSELEGLGFSEEILLPGSTTAPAGLVARL